MRLAKKKEEAEAKREAAAQREATKDFFRVHPPPAGTQPGSSYALPVEQLEVLNAKQLVTRIDPLEMRNWKVRCAAVRCKRKSTGNYSR